MSHKLSEGHITGAVRLLASSSEISSENDETLTALQRKHPPAPGDLSLPAAPGDDCLPHVASEEDIRKALSSFRKGSAGGPDGLRPCHLQSLVSRKASEAGARLLTTLTSFVNLILKGDVPEFARTVFYGATLSALGKKDGGVRPIAVGNTLRRLAVKVGSRPMVANLGESLRPIQLGVSTRGGCEAAAHATRRYLGLEGKKVIFKIDMANAFNSLRRDVFLSAVKQRAQGLYRMIWQAYSGSTTLFYGRTNLLSATGIQQGDPFGPALFSLGIDEITRRVDTELNIWYLDDGTIGDSPEKVFTCLQRLVNDLDEVGLDVNREKCELIMLNHNEEESNFTRNFFEGLMPGLRVVSVEDSSLLGAPLFERGIPAAVAEKREDLERLSSRLKLIENHQAFALLKNCFALPKLQYILRASPAYRNNEDLSQFDRVIVSALSMVTNVKFEGDSLVQASLPVRFGGLGIRMSTDIALPAFISSLHATGDLVRSILCRTQIGDDRELGAAVEKWQSEGLALAEGVLENRQRSWDEPKSVATAARLLEEADQLSRARLLASAGRESGLWLHALPVPTLGTLLDAESFRVAIALRVGAEICEPHVCRCGQRVDSRGLHGLSCRYSAGRHPRHAALNDVIRRALISAGIPSVLEPLGVDRGDGKRPDGISVFPFTDGRCLCWDATCVDTYAATHLIDSALSPGSAAKEAERRKRRKYAALGTRYRFEPIAVETAGSYGGTTGALLAEIGRRITDVTDDVRETFWLEQRVGLAIQRGNAFSILMTVKEKFDDRSLSVAL